MLLPGHCLPFWLSPTWSTAQSTPTSWRACATSAAVEVAYCSPLCLSPRSWLLELSFWWPDSPVSTGPDAMPVLVGLKQTTMKYLWFALTSSACCTWFLRLCHWPAAATNTLQRTLYLPMTESSRAVQFWRWRSSVLWSLAPRAACGSWTGRLCTRGRLCSSGSASGGAADDRRAAATSWLRGL